MLKTCPTCSYIGNDGEHVCPFCKADLATGRPRRNAFIAVPILALIVSVVLSACSVSPNGPVTMGASHGSLGSSNMADYYYSKLPGVTYTYSNVEHIYNSDGTVTTLTGANDYITTLGYDGLAPNGDSMYRIQITYQVLTNYAGRQPMDLWFIPQTNKTPGGYVTNNTQISGAVSELKRPRPVSTDTILAGVIGRVRTLTDDFTNTGTYTWQTDTLWLTCHSDSVFLWENLTTYGPNQSGLVMTRCVFSKDFVNNTTSNSNQSNVSWTYDPTSLIPWGTNTQWQLSNPDFTLSVPGNSFAHTAQIQVNTPGISITDANNPNSMQTTEFKCFSYGVGMTQLTSSWYVTSDGKTFTKQDFTRSLVSMTQN